MLHQSLFGQEHAVRVPSTKNLDGEEFERRVVLGARATGAEESLDQVAHRIVRPCMRQLATSRR